MVHFQDWPDPRVARTREHRLIDLLCGGEGFNDREDFGEAKEDGFKTFLELPGGIPSHDAFNRLFPAPDAVSFLECIVRWTQSLRAAVRGEVVALDGKALRRALRTGQSAPVLVSAWARENGLVLGQIKVSDKSNEITAVPARLRALELSGGMWEPARSRWSGTIDLPLQPQPQHLLAVFDAAFDLGLLV